MSAERSAFFSLHERLQHGIVHRLRWRELRPVQELTIQAVAAGQNVIVLAPTAGGKTEASMFPVLDGLLRQQIPPLGAIYLSPLRALLNNQEPRIKELARMVGFEAFKWHGDVSATDKRKFIQHPCQFLMITPESLEVILMTDRYDQSALFANLRYLIIDEIHGFAGDDRGDHLVALLERLAAYSQHDFQRIGLSATVGNPELLLEWMQGSSTRPGQVVNPGGVRTRRIIDILPLAEGQDATPLAAVLARGKKSLLFADSRARVERMQAGLERAGIRAFPHHGSLSRALREESEEAFRSGTNCSIVCTSTMELGLDVGDLDLVMQLGAPSTVSAFLQRLGRTGRRPGSTGHMSFLTDSSESFLVACSLVRLALKGWVEPVRPSRSSYPVFVHQLLARALAHNGLALRAALEGVGNPFCFAGLTHEERQEVIDGLLERAVLSLVDGRLVMGPAGEREFGRSNFLRLYSVFDTPPNLSVRTANNQEIGTLESWFVQSSTDQLCFLLGGKAWEMERVDWDRAILTVKPARAGRAPNWMGSPQSYSRELCQDVLALLREHEAPAFLGPRARSYLTRVREEYAEVVAGTQPLTYQRQGDSVLLYTFAGARINNLIARLHEVRTGKRVVVHNFYLKTAVPAQGSYFSELSATLEHLASQEPDQQALVAGLNRSRLSKFQPFLPAHLEARMLAERLFEAAGGREVAGAPARAATPVARVEKALPVDFADPFLGQLAQLADQHRAANKWVFVPYPSLKWSLGERLCLARRNWVNLRFVTPFELALEIAAPELLARQVHPKPEGLGPALAARLLEELPGETPAHFRPLADQPRMAEVLWQALKSLRMAGIDSAALPSSDPREQEFKALYQAYERYLEQQRLGDRATLFQTAIDWAERSPVAADDFVLEMPTALWTPLERAFLDALPGRHLAARVPRLEPPRRWSELTRQPVDQPESCDLHRLRQLQAIQPKGQPSADGSLELFHAGRRDAEIHEVLRRIVSLTAPLDQVEIGVHDRDALCLLWDKLEKHGLAATFEEGLPVTALSPARAMLGVMEWVEQRFSAFHLRGLLLSDALRTPLPAPRAARLLEEAGTSWGRDTYQRSLEQLEARYRSRADRLRDENEQAAQALSEQAELVSQLRGWLHDILLLFPEPDQTGEVDLAELVQGLVTLVRDTVPVRSDLDRSAQQVMLRALDDILLLRGRRLGLGDALRQVRDLFESLRAGSSRALPGCLHVTRLDRVGLVGRPYLYLMALEEGTLVPDGAEDPVLPDRIRQALHPGLERASDRGPEFVFRVLERLACLDGHATLSCSRRDLRSGEELLPSWLFLRTARLRYADLQDQDDLFRVLGEPVGLAPEQTQQAASDTEWWLARLAGAGPPAEALVRGGFPWLLRGHQARQARSSNAFTAYDGLVVRAARLLDPRHNGQPVSVSRLQNLAGCPYRFFLSDGLGLTALSLEPIDPGRWLNAANRGTALHEVFAAYHRELRQRGLAPDYTRDLGRLEQLLNQELARLRHELPPPSSAVEEEETRRLLRDLERFLRLETTHPERQPIAFEVGFGLPELFDEPLARRQPVTITLSDDLRFDLRGRIDRIDRIEAQHEVVDYKTGTYLASQPNVHYDQGRLLQHALYALVAEQLLGQPVDHSSYYFPIVGVEREWLRFAYPDKEELRAVLADVLEPLASGAFAHAPDPDKDCKFCDFRSACSSHDKQQFQTKLDNPDNSVLACRLRLKKVR